MLTQQEQDIFQDIAETGLIESLRALTKLSGRQWSAFLNPFAFATMREAKSSFSPLEPPRFAAQLNLDGEIPMRILCVFPQESAITLVHFLTAGMEPPPAVSSIQSQTVAEVANIISNAFLGVIANTLKLRLLASAPQPLSGTPVEILTAASANDAAETECALSTELRLESENLTMAGTLYILVNAGALKNLVSRIHGSPAWTLKRFRIF
jgi:chemotaxis protein CheY-P-specific phosphatase CheC